MQVFDAVGLAWLVPWLLWPFLCGLAGMWAGHGAHMLLHFIVRREATPSPAPAIPRPPPATPSPSPATADTHRNYLIVSCQHCGKKLRVAELDRELLVTCPNCGASFPQVPAKPVAAGFTRHRKIIASLNIGVGGVSGLCALLFMAQAITLLGGSSDFAMAAMYASLSVLSLGSSIVPIAAGISLIRRGARCRKLAIASGIVSCVSVCVWGWWGCWCCTYPLCIGCGIYTLVIMLGANAKKYLP